MAKSKVLTEKEVIKQIGTRKLNPALIDAALSVLRGLYLGYVYPHELKESLYSGKPLPIGSLLLNPTLSEKLSDSIGPVNIPILQKLIEDAATAGNRVAEVTNKIFDIQNRVQAKAQETFGNLPIGEGPGLKDIKDIPVKFPKIPPPFTGEYINAASQMFFIDSMIENEHRKERNREIERNGFDLPKDADAGKTLESMMKLVSESILLSDTMSLKNLTYEMALKDVDFSRERKKLFNSIEAEGSRLKSDPAFNKYIETFPVVTDAITAMFVGEVPAALIIPTRELAAAALIAASSPAVRNEAYKMATMQGDMQRFKAASNAAITKAIMDGGFTKARLIPEIATMHVFTSPFYWESLGLKYPGKNHVWELMQGVGDGIRSIRQNTNNKFIKTALGWFEDKEVIKLENFEERFFSMLKNYLGETYGEDVAKAVQAEYKNRVGDELLSSKQRYQSALKLREFIHGMVRSKTAHLSKEEMSAAIMKLQDIPKTKAPDAVQSAWESPFVDDAVDYMRESLNRIRRFDPSIPQDDLYFPASKSYAKSEAEYAAYYRSRKYLKEREVVSQVLPNFDDPDITMDQFVDRLASPIFDPIMISAEKSIGKAAGVAMEVLEDVVKNPDKVFKDITRIVGNVSITKPDHFNKILGNFMHFKFLTSRAPAWMGAEWFDDGIRMAVNQYDNFKNGKWPMLSDLKVARKIPEPIDLFNKTFQSSLIDDASNLSFNLAENVNTLNKMAFSVAAKGANWRLSKNFHLNLAGEINKLRRAKGIPASRIDTLTEKIISTGESGLKDIFPEFTEREISGLIKNAADSAKEYQLARRANTAFSTNWFTRLMTPYIGFFAESTKLMVKTLGREPEIFVAGAAMLRNLKEMNEEMPEFLRESIKIGDRAVPLLRRTSFYPMYRILEDDLFGPMDTLDERQKKDWETLKTIDDPKLRMQILDRNPKLREYGQTGITKAIPDFIEAAREYNAIPLGGGFDVVAKALGMPSKRMVGIVPFGKEFSQVSKLLGIENLDIEKNLGTFVGALRADAYTTDHAIEELLIRHRGEAVADPEVMRKMADTAVKKKIFDDLIFKRTLGAGTALDPGLIEFQNALSDLYNRKDLVVPDRVTIEKLRTKYNLNEDQANLVWKNGYDAADLIASKMEDFEQSLLDRMPLLSQYQKLTQDSYQKKVILGIKERMDMRRRVPQDNIKELTEADNIVQALIESYGDDDLGKGIFSWMKLTPKEKIEKLKTSPTDNVIAKRYFPAEYKQFQNYIEPNGMVATPQTIEDEYAGGLTKDLFNSLKEMSRFNPFGVSQPLVDIYLNATPGNIQSIKEELKKKGEDFIQKSKELFDKLPSIIPAFGGTLSAEEFPLFGDEREKKQFEEDSSPAHRFAKQEAQGIIKEYYTLQAKNGGKLTREQSNQLQDFWENNVLKNPNPKVRTYMSIFHNGIWRSHGGSEGKGRISSDDIVGTVANYSQSAQMNQYLRDIQDAMYNPASKKENFQQLMAQGRQVMLGRKLSEWLNRDGRTRPLLKVVDKLANGYDFGIERRRPPDFNLDEEGQLAKFEDWIDTAYRRPGETVQSYHARVLDKFSPEKMQINEFNDRIDVLRKHGQFETIEALKRNYGGSFAVLPLDQSTKDKIRSLQDQLPFIENDPALMMEALGQQPDLLETIRTYEPRIYRGFENKVWGELDSEWKSYLGSTGYSPEVIDYYKRMAPQSYSRNFYRDTKLRAISSSLGFEQPEPTAEVAMVREDGKEFKVPSIFAPNVAPPVPTPDGVFSSLPSALQYIQMKSVRDANVLLTARSQGAKLTSNELDFINASPTERVFLAMPGAVAQGFRDGKLGPDDVIKTLSGFNQFAATTGMITPERASDFNQFLNNSSAVIGATQFGANLGKFLDDTFNIPRLPFKSAAADFLIFGKPVSSLPSTDTRNKFNTPVLPAVYTSAFPRVDGTGIGNLEFQARQPTSGLPKTANKLDLASSVSGIGSASGAAAGLPVVGAAFAVISAGFTIYNILQSRRSRKRSEAAARAAEAERQRQIELAKAEAESLRSQAEQRQLANIRFQRMQGEEQSRIRDFENRSRAILESPVPIASLSLQPKEFVDTFIDKFQAKALEFIRRPTFSSRVGLISQGEGGLPNARF